MLHYCFFICNGICVNINAIVSVVAVVAVVVGLGLIGNSLLQVVGYKLRVTIAR